MKRVSKSRNVILLLLTDLIWGTAFVAQSTGGNEVGAYAFNCIRFLIGAVVLLPVIKFLDKGGYTSKRPKTKDERNVLWVGGICCGIALCLASNLQQVGITMGTETGKAGFLTATYILMVPVIGLFFKRKCGAKIWLGDNTDRNVYALCKWGVLSEKTGYTAYTLRILFCNTDITYRSFFTYG